MFDIEGHNQEMLQARPHVGLMYVVLYPREECLPKNR
jgi:hypothetical protein